MKNLKNLQKKSQGRPKKIVKNPKIENSQKNLKKKNLKIQKKISNLKQKSFFYLKKLKIVCFAKKIEEKLLYS